MLSQPCLSGLGSSLVRAQDYTQFTLLRNPEELARLLIARMAEISCMVLEAHPCRVPVDLGLKVVRDSCRPFSFNFWLPKMPQGTDTVFVLFPVSFLPVLS